MYIHSYQIHNVLNVYRQQLSKGTPKNISGNRDKGQGTRDSIVLSEQGPRETLFEKISSEIVQRITQFGPNTESESGFLALPAEARKNAHYTPKTCDGKKAVFSYTLIDNNNQKTTHNLSIRQLRNSYGSTEKVRPLIEVPSTTNLAPDSE